MYNRSPISKVLRNMPPYPTLQRDALSHRRGWSVVVYDFFFTGALAAGAEGFEPNVDCDAFGA